MYKGVYYSQGQTWDDGCDLNCRCEDVMRGYYTCSQRYIVVVPFSRCVTVKIQHSKCTYISDKQISDKVIYYHIQLIDGRIDVSFNIVTTLSFYFE